MIEISLAFASASCGHLWPDDILKVVLDEVFHHRFWVRVFAQLRLSALLVKDSHIVLHNILGLKLRYWGVKFVRHFLVCFLCLVRWVIQYVQGNLLLAGLSPILRAPYMVALRFYCLTRSVRHGIVKSSIIARHGAAKLPWFFDTLDALRSVEKWSNFASWSALTI